uniref:Uncharacterized protein n=1 Tax=Plectus sambesii TaxID=2011161 RepID=A0A914XRT0_9BILA
MINYCANASLLEKLPNFHNRKSWHPSEATWKSVNRLSRPIGRDEKFLPIQSVTVHPQLRCKVQGARGTRPAQGRRSADYDRYLFRSSIDPSPPQPGSKTPQLPSTASE